MRGWMIGACLLTWQTAVADGTDLMGGRADTRPPELTGNLTIDFFGLTDTVSGPGAPDAGVINEGGEKSPWLAAGMSLLVPGSGEAYAGSYWKAAAFFAIEVAAWTVAYTQDKKGDEQTSFYQDYANEHWNVVTYGAWSENKFGLSGRYDWLIANSEGSPPWERVNWDQLNSMEREIASTAAGQYYSHVLPRWNEQQYYELIGKYQQYNQGWDDAPPDYTYPEPVTANFSYYSVERGKANDYYSTASTAVTIALINHLLSAIDAAWSASSHNSVHARVEMQSIPLGGRMAHVPAARFEYGF